MKSEITSQSPQGGRRIRMQSEIATTTQSLAWDQVSKKKYGSEKQMGVLPPANPDQIDALLFQGGLELKIPAVTPLAAKSLPPWQRMK